MNTSENTSPDFNFLNTEEAQEFLQKIDTAKIKDIDFDYLIANKLPSDRPEILRQSYLTDAIETTEEVDHQ